MLIEVIGLNAYHMTVISAPVEGLKYLNVCLLLFTCLTSSNATSKMIHFYMGCNQLLAVTESTTKLRMYGNSSAFLPLRWLYPKTPQCPWVQSGVDCVAEFASPPGGKAEGMYIHVHGIYTDLLM